MWRRSRSIFCFLSVLSQVLGTVFFPSLVQANAQLPVSAVDEIIAADQWARGVLGSLYTSPVHTHQFGPVTSAYARNRLFRLIRERRLNDYAYADNISIQCEAPSSRDVSLWLVHHPNQSGEHLELIYQFLEEGDWKLQAGYELSFSSQHSWQAALIRWRDAHFRKKHSRYRAMPEAFRYWTMSMMALVGEGLELASDPSVGDGELRRVVAQIEQLCPPSYLTTRYRAGNLTVR